MNFGYKALTARAATDCLILPVNVAEPSAAFTAIDTAAGGRLRAVLDGGDLANQPGKAMMVRGLEGIAAPRVLLLAIGTRPLSVADLNKVIDTAAAETQGSQARSALIDTQPLASADRGPAWVVRTLVQTFSGRAWRFRGTRRAGVESPRLARLDVAGPDRATIRRAIAEGEALAAGMELARELGNLPGNICTPEYLAGRARQMARGDARTTARILDEKKMRELGMGSLLSVGAGSRQPSRLIALEYRGGPRDAAPIALVGKGITFDTGGISLKPGAAMDEMKFDMCGAAAVLGTLRVAQVLELPLNIIAVVAAAENMPDGNATKPGDVVTTMAGLTIEILNTDAEGRLVLCDALTWVQRYKPEVIIDVATLTGACIVALGNTASGLFSPDDDLAAALTDAGNWSHDRVWRLPVWEEHQQALRSNFADMANIGGSEAGSSLAAAFLWRFVREQRWAHLDVAGTTFLKGPAKGATGRPVPMLAQYLFDRAGRPR